ncbi:MAG: TIGR02996 domain-containing protein [Kofleriaceae bacterium]
MMEIGALCDIVSGPYEGHAGKILGVETEHYVVEVELHGRPSRVRVAASNLKSVDDGVDDVIAWFAAEAGALWQKQWTLWWVAQFQRAAKPGDEAVARELDALEIATPGLFEFRAAVEPRIVTDFTPIAADDRRAKWLAEREHYLRGLPPVPVPEWPPDPSSRYWTFEQLEDRATRLQHRITNVRDRLRLSSPPPVEPSNPALEAAIGRQPTDDNFRIYGDWLQEQGHPRGELIALDLSHGNRMLAAHLRARLAYPLDTLHDVIYAQWRNGYIDSVVFESGPAAARALFAHPMSRFVREIEVALTGRERIGLEARASLRRLGFTTNIHTGELSWTDAGAIGAATEALFPHLQILDVSAGRFAFEQTPFPSLRRLTLQTTNLERESFANVIELDGGALEHLEIWFGSSRRNVHTPLDLIEKLVARPWPKLRTLSLSNGEHTDELVEIVLRSPLCAQLEALSFTGSTLTDEGARRLIASAGVLAHLEQLDVTHNFLSHDTARQLHLAIPATEGHDEQRGWQDYRYAMTEE